MPILAAARNCLLAGPHVAARSGTSRLSTSQREELHAVGKVLQVPGSGQHLHVFNALPDGDSKLVGCTSM